jgi:hypothetical protein
MADPRSPCHRLSPSEQHPRSPLMPSSIPGSQKHEARSLPRAKRSSQPGHVARLSCARVLALCPPCPGVESWMTGAGGVTSIASCRAPPRWEAPGSPWQSRCGTPWCCGLWPGRIPPLPRTSSRGWSRRLLAGTRIPPRVSGRAHNAGDGKAPVSDGALDQEQQWEKALSLTHDSLMR